MIYVSLAAILLGYIVCIFAVLRNTTVYRVRIFVLTKCNPAAYKQLPSYEKMMWQFGKWTVKDWIGELESTK